LDVAENSIQNHSRKLNVIPSASHLDLWPYLQIANVTDCKLTVSRGRLEAPIDVLTPSQMAKSGTENDHFDEDCDEFDDYYEKMLEPPPDEPLSVHPEDEWKPKAPLTVKLVLQPKTTLKSNCTYVVLLLKGVPLTPSKMMEDDFMAFVEANYVAVDHVSKFTTKSFI
jgi:hypothetical protein